MDSETPTWFFPFFATYLVSTFLCFLYCLDINLKKKFYEFCGIEQPKRSFIPKVPIKHLYPLNQNTLVNFQEAYNILCEESLFKVAHNNDYLIGEGYMEIKEDFIPQVVCTFNIITAYKSKHYCYTTMEKQLYPFTGRKHLFSLDICPVGVHDLERARERGKQYITFTQSPCYKYGKGVLYGRKLKITNDGRIMIDATGYNNFSAATDSNIARLVNPEGKEHLMDIDLPVFSMDHKIWGKMDFRDISEIQFNDNVYDNILSDRKDHLINVIRHYYSLPYNNFMMDRNKGLIILFHGPPGTGKTLTVNALAEVLHLPLYKLGLREVGKLQGDLERKLEDIFKMVKEWKGILLIDEADLFVAQRTKNNVYASIFLRLLEDFSGIVFLTTNVPHLIDPAIQNRVTLSIAFDIPNKNSRKHLWNTSLNIPHINIDALAEYNLSNRDIMNIIYLVYLELGGDMTKSTTELFKHHAHTRQNIIASHN